MREGQVAQAAVGQTDGGWVTQAAEVILRGARDDAEGFEAVHIVLQAASWRLGGQLRRY